MSIESKILMRELHVLISGSVNYAEEMLDRSEIIANDYLGGNISEDDIYTLRTIDLTVKQKNSLRKLLTAIGRLSVAGTLGVIDGVIISEKFDLPNLALINREAQQDIADEFLLNEEFYQYVDDE